MIAINLMMIGANTLQGNTVDIHKFDVAELQKFLWITGILELAKVACMEK